MTTGRNKEAGPQVEIKDEDSRLRVLCLEGEWDASDDQAEQTVRPFLEVLVAQDDILLAHRTAATRAEFFFHLDRWRDRRRLFGEYELLYVASHGDPGRLWISKQQSVTVLELSKRLTPGLQGRAIHFGSCCVLKQRRKTLERFRKETKAAFVSGYTVDIDWLQSAALDMLFLSHLAREGGSLYSAVDRLREDASGLVGTMHFETEPRVPEGAAEPRRS